MQRPRIGGTGLILLGALSLCAFGSARLNRTAAPPSLFPPASVPLSIPRPLSHAVAQDFGHLPLSFEVNRGQTDQRVQFLAHRGQSTLFLTPTAAVFSLQGPPVSARKTQAVSASAAPVSPPWAGVHRSAVLRMELVGANPRAQAQAATALPGRVNYLLGRDPKRWHTNIPLVAKVGYRQVYPGVDVVYYGQGPQLEYDFVVQPHADAHRIGVRFAGATGAHLTANGALVVEMPGGRLEWKPPTVYQEAAGQRRTVSCRYVLGQTAGQTPTVRLALGRYDRERRLVIDPALSYATYLGGSGVAGGNGDQVTALAVDGSGSAYVAGFTYSTDFPTTPGAYQSANKDAANNGTNAFVARLKPDGSDVIYATYIGGSDSAAASAIAVDSSGNAYVAGSAASSDFPTTPGAFQIVNNGVANKSPNAFVAKLKADGTSLLYSTFLGGTGTTDGNGDSASAITVDSAGSAYVAGSTYSTDFPTTPTAYQTFHSSPTYNAFIAKLLPNGTNLVYSTFLGGSNYDAASAIKVDSAGNAYVTGSTASSDFPITPGAYQTTNKAAANNGTNAFITKILPDGTNLVYSTLLGGSTYDAATALSLDSGGNTYVAGLTYSTDFPITAGAFQTTNNAAANQQPNAFVARLKADGSGLFYATYLGGTGALNGGDQASALGIDSLGNACVAGSTYSTDFPTTPGAFQTTNNGAAHHRTNAFVSRLKPDGSGLLYSTFLGGSSSDSASALAVDSAGNAYVAGYTYSIDFPTTPGAFQITNKGATNNGTSGFSVKFSFVPFDFNGDGHNDLVFQNSSTNRVAVWYMNGATVLGNASLSLTPAAGWKVVAIGDFNGDGQSDVVYQNQTTNQVAIWYMNGVTFTSGAFTSLTPATGWKVVGSGDFNGDGKADLVFQNSSTNRVAVWYMNGATYAGGGFTSLTPATGWKVVGVGDFNGDGKPDLVFQNSSTNQIAVWYMNGLKYTGGAFTSLPGPAGWHVAGVADLNGDGKPDLLFQNQASGLAAIWFMNGVTFVSGAYTSTAPAAGWQLVGPR